MLLNFINYLYLYFLYLFMLFHFHRSETFVVQKLSYVLFLLVIYFRETMNYSIMKNELLGEIALFEIFNLNQVIKFRLG